MNVTIPFSTFRAAMLVAAKNDDRDYLCGAHFNKEKNRIESTNGRMLFTSEGVDLSEMPESFVIPNVFSKKQMKEGYCSNVGITKENDDEYRVSFLFTKKPCPPQLVRCAGRKDEKFRYPDIDSATPKLEGQDAATRKFAGNLFAIAGKAMGGNFTEIRFHEEDKVKGATVFNKLFPENKILIYGLLD